MSNIDEIVEAIAILDPDNKEHFTQGGVPSVEALEAATGISEISGAERDEAWEKHLADVDAKAEAERAKTDADAEAADKAAKDLEAASKKAKKGFFVEEGCSVTSRKGIKGPGDRVTAEVFGKGKIGEDALKNMCDAGKVKEVK